MNKSEAKVKSLYKSLQILDCFSAKKPQLGISEVAKMLNMTKSNVHNIVSTLVYAGYLEKEENSEKYCLTNKMLEFSYIITHQLTYQATVQLAMQKLAKKVRGVVYFGILHGSYVLYMFATLPHNEDTNLVVRSIMGEKAPLYCTSIGKALLMTLPEKEILNRFHSTPKEKYTANTLTTDKELLANISTSKKRGYAEDLFEHEENVRCIGVPISTHTGDYIGAMSVSGLPIDISEEEISDVIKALQNTALEIRTQL